MNKLVTVIMGQNATKFLPMCLESVKDSDAIVYCDGGSDEKFIDDLYCKYGFNDGSIEPKIKYAGITLIQNKYDQEDPAMNGKQRNFYLNYLKEVYPDYWCLAIDADEVVEDLMYIIKYIQTAKSGLYNIHMRHFHNDLGHEDATAEKHWVLNRLFKVSEAGGYDLVEHPVLVGLNKENYFQTDCTTIWHLAHINHCFNIKGRYEKNLKHSNMHSKEFLDQWKDAHMFGTYPNKLVDPTDIPDIILKNFHIDKDKYYFMNRGIDMKHPIMVQQWNEYFKPKSVLDLGCGRGCYLYFWRWFVPYCLGLEISEWAIKNRFADTIEKADISNVIFPEKDLITAIDVLEHLNDEELNNVLNGMEEKGNKFIFSIPFIGDPNLINDKTHKQFKTKEEWIKLIESKGIKIEPTPEHWLFKDQILIGRKDLNTN